MNTIKSEDSLSGHAINLHVDENPHVEVVDKFTVYFRSPFDAKLFYDALLTMVELEVLCHHCENEESL